MACSIRTRTSPPRARGRAASAARDHTYARMPWAMPPRGRTPRARSRDSDPGIEPDAAEKRAARRRVRGPRPVATGPHGWRALRARGSRGIPSRLEVRCDSRGWTRRRDSEIGELGTVLRIAAPGHRESGPRGGSVVHVRPRPLLRSAAATAYSFNRIDDARRRVERSSKRSARAARWIGFATRGGPAGSTGAARIVVRRSAIDAEPLTRRRGKRHRSHARAGGT